MLLEEGEVPVVVHGVVGAWQVRRTGQRRVRTRGAAGDDTQRRTAQNVALSELLGAVAVAEKALQLPLVLLPAKR